MTESDVGFVALGVLAVVFIVYFVIMGLSIANYIMVSLSIHKIGSRRQIANSWLAWLPIANYWIIGSIADDYDKRQGHNRKWRTSLLTLALVGIGGFLIMYISMIIAVIALTFAEANYEPTISSMLSIILPLYLAMIVGIVVLAALNICNAVCVFKIFESTVPEKALKYFLIYLLVPLGSGICLMKCRNSGYDNPPPTNPYYYVLATQTEQPVIQQPVVDTECENQDESYEINE